MNAGSGAGCSATVAQRYGSRFADAAQSRFRARQFACHRNLEYKRPIESPRTDCWRSTRRPTDHFRSLGVIRPSRSEAQDRLCAAIRWILGEGRTSCMPTIKNIPGPYRFFFYSFDCNEPEHVHVQRENKVLQVLAQAIGVGPQRRFFGARIESDPCANSTESRYDFGGLA